MTYVVNKETEMRTTRCPHNSRCLNDDGWTSCSIQNVMGEFLEINKCGCDKRQCNYLMPYGFSYYCLCPVRHEIYKNYGI